MPWPHSFPPRLTSLHLNRHTPNGGHAAALFSVLVASPSLLSLRFSQSRLGDFKCPEKWSERFCSVPGRFRSWVMGSAGHPVDNDLTPSPLLGRLSPAVWDLSSLSEVVLPLINAAALLRSFGTPTDCQA